MQNNNAKIYKNINFYRKENNIKIFSNGILIILGIALLVLYFPIKKPLWIDEFLYFAFGSFDSVFDVIEKIYKTAVEINHGQTGIYILVDYILLKIFGASLFALRLPSILSACLLLVSAIAFMRAKQVGITGQIGLMIAYAGQVNLMIYMGEARPYMPLAASVVGVLAYYAFPIAQRRKKSIQALGWISVVMGSSMHPYFCLYWYVIIITSYVTQQFERPTKVNIHNVLLFINLRLFILGTGVGFLIGLMTWLRKRTVNLDFDPFEWITQGLWVEFTTFSHFAFIPNARVFIIITILTVISYLIVNAKIKESIKPLLGPSILMLSSLSISIFLGYISYSQNYWILHRQWIASEALVPISLVWFIYLIIKKIKQKNKFLYYLLALFCFLYLSNYVYKLIQDRLNTQLNYISKEINKDRQHLNTGFELTRLPEDNDEWVNLANSNLLVGGKVWPIFKNFYERHL